ncbi:MAG: DUF2142 domain-containing protein [Actinomycetota bacterium]
MNDTSFTPSDPRPVDQPEPCDHRPGRAWALTMFAVLLGLFGTWAVAMPLFTSPDEPAHLFKAYASAHGELVGDAVEGFSPNIRLFDLPPELYVTNLNCYFGKPDVPASCATEPDGLPMSSAAVYPPFWYAAVGIPPRVVQHDTSQRTYRMVAAALCAAAIAAAFVVARRSQAGHLTPLLLIGFTPMTMFLAGTVNPNAFEVALFVFLWTLCLHLDHPRAHAAFGGVLVGATLAIALLSRFASAIWAVVGLLVVIALIGTQGIRRFVNRRFLGAAAACIAPALALLAWWTSYARVQVDEAVGATSMSVADIVTTTARRLPELAQQMIGVLGWLDTDLPWIVYALFVMFTLVVVVGVVRSGNRRLQLATAVVAVALVATPLAINAFAGSRAGLIWQGRYSLPLFAALGPIGMLAWHRVISDSPDPHLPARTATLLRWGACTVFAVAEVAGFWQALRRFTVGADGTWWLAGELPWRPAVAPLLLIALNIVLVAAMCALMLNRTQRAPATVPSPD